MKTQTKLGKVQLQIMQILWERGQATAREITDALSSHAPIAHSTTQTLLRKMEAKGAISHDPAERVFVFRPVIVQGEVKQNAAHDLLTRVFQGSLTGLVAHLLKHETISPDEQAYLRELIDSADTKERGNKQ